MALNHSIKSRNPDMAYEEPYPRSSSETLHEPSSAQGPKPSPTNASFRKLLVPMSAFAVVCSDCLNNN
jgi:hypothetical protein